MSIKLLAESCFERKKQHLFMLTTVNLTKDETSDILWGKKKNLDPSGGLQKLWCHPLWTITILTTCHLIWFITVSVFVSVSDWYNTLSILPQNLFWLKMQLKSFELYWHDITVITSQKKIWGLRCLMLFLFYSTYCGYSCGLCWHNNPRKAFLTSCHVSSCLLWLVDITF